MDMNWGVTDSNGTLIGGVSVRTPNGNPSNGFGVVEEDKDHPFKDDDF